MRERVCKEGEVTFNICICLQVAWLRNSEHKFFEYIHRRNPPFRNFSTPGADIDVSIKV